MRQVEVRRHHDPRGSLSAVDCHDCPFPIKRVYYLYDIPGGETQRGGHANKKCRRLMFALSGSFSVATINNCLEREVTFLNRPWMGVEIPPMTWLELVNFSSGAVCLVLASEPYDTDDYIRDLAEWTEATKC